MKGDEFAGECDDYIAFFDQLRSDQGLHRHPKLHRTTLCVTGPPQPNQNEQSAIMRFLRKRTARPSGRRPEGRGPDGYTDTRVSGI